jgi:hypothetical protein
LLLGFTQDRGRVGFEPVLAPVRKLEFHFCVIGGRRAKALQFSGKPRETALVGRYINDLYIINE